MSEDSLKLTPKLQPGRLLLVVDGPVRASGYDWYQVAPLKEAFSKEKLPFGWVAAAGKDGAHWIDPVEMESPDLPASIRDIDDLDENGERYYGVACHANREIVLDGWLGLEGGECLRRPAWGVEPAPFHPCTVRKYGALGRHGRGHEFCAFAGARSQYRRHRVQPERVADRRVVR